MYKKIQDWKLRNFFNMYNMKYRLVKEQENKVEQFQKKELMRLTNLNLNWKM